MLQTCENTGLSASFEEKQAATKVKEHTRSRKSGNVRDILPESIEVVEVEHTLPEEERACPQCGETMQPIGKEVQESLEFIPAKAILKRDIYYTYACENCKKNDISTPIVKTPKDAVLIPISRWLYRTGGDAEHPIVLYDYAPGRGQEYPNAFLKGFHGYLQTDGYSGYHGLKGVTHVGCWAHARRKFDEACRAMPKGKRSPTAEQGVAYCTQLFELEKELKREM